ncbi:unnamed protein product [Prorocentrum cordatum]|uniref:Uncharacterized protein n=1 Tax=Prorocentrum cordatum TaxID=2364126 RepID=A0ABN9QEU7_9DINO|nr:unnamed protein product [Polarella glacialis]
MENMPSMDSASTHSCSFLRCASVLVYNSHVRKDTGLPAGARRKFLIPRGHWGPTEALAHLRTLQGRRRGPPAFTTSKISSRMCLLFRCPRFWGPEVGRPLPTVAPRGLSRSVARAAQGRAPMRCPGWPNCGCDGQGHLVGPLGKFMENSPIKVGAVWGTEEAQHSFRPARRRAGSRFWFREDPGPSKTDPG